MTPAQCRAARAIARITQEELAKEALLSARALQKFEAEETRPHRTSVASLKRALEKRGVEFQESGWVRPSR